MTTLLKTLKMIAACLLILVLLVTLALCWVIFTETGTRLLFSTAERYQLLSYQSLSGSISKGLAIEQLTVNQRDVKIRIKHLSLTADWSQVLYSKVDIEQLSAQSVTLELPEKTNKSPAKLAPELSFLNDRLVFVPLAIQLQKLSIAQLTVINAEQSHHIHDIQLAALIDERGISASKLNLGYQQSSLQLEGDFLFAPKLNVDLTLAWQTVLPADTRITGSGRLKGNGRQLRVDHQSQGGLKSDVIVELLNWRKQPRLKLQGSIDSLSWPLAETAGNTPPRLSNIHFNAEGDFSALRTTASGQLQLNENSNNNLLLNAEVTPAMLTISKLELADDSGGMVLLAGQLNWPDGKPSWQTTARFQQFDGQTLHPLLPQQLAGQVAITGSFASELALEIASDNLRGELQNRLFESQIKLRMADQTLLIEKLTAQVGDNKLAASGELNDSIFNVKFDAQLDDLTTIIPDANGAIQANGLLTGSMQRPNLTAKLAGQQIKFNSFSASELALNVKLLDGIFVAAENQLSAQQLRYQAVYLDQLAVQFDGFWREPQVQLQTTSSLLKTDLQSSLNLNQLEQITGTLTALNIAGESNGGESFNGEKVTAEGIGNWQLEQPVKFQLGTEKWFLSQLCLQNKGRLCVEAASVNKKIRATLNAEQLPVSLLNATGLLAPAISGRLDIAAQLEIVGKQQQGQLRISQSRADTPLILTAVEQSNTQLRIADLVFESALKNGRLNGNFNALLNETGSLSSQFEIQQLLTDHSPLQARVDYNIPDLQAYALLIPEVDNLNGQLAGNIQLSNSLQKPQVALYTRLSVPKIYINALAMEWHDLNAEITTLSGNKQQLKASLKSGDGQLNLDGTLDFSSLQNWLSELTIKGDNVLLLDQPKRRVIASPDMQIKASARKLEVSGKLAIPEAKLVIESSPNRLTLTSDAVIHNEDGELTNNTEPFEYYLNLDVLLGDQVHFEAYGLKTNVTGKLNLTKQPSQDLLGQGELNLVDGAYKSYGQDLTIERGVIRFTGLLNQPEIDLTASRRVQSVVAGLKVNGPVDNLRTRLYSEPPMQDSEILSYIIRGRPLRGANAADQNALANALLAYSISQSTPVTSKLTELSGLDEIGLEAEEGVETLGFTLGKYITPRLYARYGIGVIDKLSKVFLQYQLSDKLYLETESGQGQSVDLMYRSR